MKRTAIAIAVGALSTSLAHGVLAQEEDAQLGDEQQMTQEGQEQQYSDDSATNGQDQAEIRVEEEAADVNVDQEPAEVQVDQQPPDVTVEQQPPEVTIEQQDPNVNVDQAEPNVTVDSSGEADVEVEHAEGAEAELNNPDEQNQQQNSDQAAQDQATQEQASQDNLMNRQVSEIEGYTVYSQENDEEIGDVERVVRDTQSNDTYAVISEGGFLGFGADEMGYSIDELEIRNEDELVVQSADSGESADFSSDQYEDVDSDMTLNETMQQ